MVRNIRASRKKARDIFKPDTSKYKKDIDVVRENHRFLWEDEEGDEINNKVWIYLLMFLYKVSIIEISEKKTKLGIAFTKILA